MYRSSIDKNQSFAESRSAKTMEDKAKSRAPHCGADPCESRSNDVNWILVKLSQSTYITIDSLLPNCVPIIHTYLQTKTLKSKPQSVKLILKMPLPVITSEKPSTSETKETVKNTQSTSTPSTSSNTKSEAELAAEKLYEERMEEEYAKREGGA